MSKINKFEDLTCWKRARALLKRIYKETDENPFRKDFILKDQIRRSSLSVMANISETKFNEIYNQTVEVAKLTHGLINYLRRS